MEGQTAWDIEEAEKVMGWTREGKEYQIKPLHKPSLDFPGEMIDDWESKGPHNFLISPDGEHRVAFCGCDSNLESLPNYCQDLNHAYLMEEKFKGRKRSNYVANLVKVVGAFDEESMIARADNFDLIHATARQRSEAAYLIFKDEPNS